MAAEDRAKLRDLLITAATPLLAPRTFDLIVDEDGIALEMEGNKTPVASAKEIADGSFKATFAGRLCKAAGIEDRDIGAEVSPAHEQETVRRTAEPPGKPLPEIKLKTSPTSRRHTKPQLSIPVPPLAMSRLPPPKWVAAVAAETGTVAAPEPEIHPVCAPTMRLTRRAQSILDEHPEWHGE